jgi:tetratricopeptide (TPR) repeat protein
MSGLPDDERTEHPPNRIGSKNQIDGANFGSSVQAASVHGGVHFGTSVVPQWPTPRQLPISTRAFVDRNAELAKLDDLLESSSRAPIVISAISGAGGIGKTELAIHWAHIVKDKFPDGQIYINLRGFGQLDPIQPSEFFADFFASFGIAKERIPARLDAQGSLYRSVLGGKRVLVILDNALNSSQVRPLLPGTDTCVVIVTSRHRLDSLAIHEGALHITLDDLSQENSIALLRRILGAQRVNDEAESATEIARLCEYMPLALRIAAVRAQRNSYISLSDLAESLRDYRRRLDSLTANDDPVTSIRAVISWSYEKLSLETARGFRLLGLHFGPDISSAAALAALGHSNQGDGERILDDLVGAHLLKRIARDRYRFHDLVQAFAAEQADLKEHDRERHDAFHRILDWYLHTADNAEHYITPHRRRVEPDPCRADVEPFDFDNYHDALEWCDKERANLLAAIRVAAELGFDRHAWLFPRCLWGFYDLRKHWTDWITSHEIALGATRRLGERVGEGRILNSLGLAFREVERFEESIALHIEAVDVFRQIADEYGVAITLNELGLAFLETHEFDRALSCHTEALDITRRISDHFREAQTISALGHTYHQMGEYQRAIDCFSDVLAINQDLEDRRTEGVTHANLGGTYLAMASLNEAIDHFRRALPILREMEDSWHAAEALYGWGVALGQTGDIAGARAYLEEALGILDDLGSPRGEVIRTQLDFLT